MHLDVAHGVDWTYEMVVSTSVVLPTIVSQVVVTVILLSILFIMGV
jgi:hypothetical protein